jgi:Zn-dependent peptidase ImmA (M78 family)
MFARGFKTYCEDLAALVRSNLQLPAVAPLPPERLAASLRVTLWTPEDVPGLSPEVRDRLLNQHAGSWSAFSLADGNRWLILYNSSHSQARTASNVMHELAHILLEHRPGKMVITTSGMALRSFDRTQEDQAGWLSGCLLLPRAALLHIVKTRMTAGSAREEYLVSNELLRFRMNATGVNLQARRSASRRW